MSKSIPSLILFLLSTFLSAQLLDKEVAIAPGTYGGLELAQILQQQEVPLSYASTSLRKVAVQIREKHYQVRLLLERIFDLKHYRYLEKDGKILIVPIGEGEITLSGYVEDAESHERLIGAQVYLPQLKTGTVTNTYGFYSLSLAPPGDSLQLQVSSIGYSSTGIRLSPDRNHHLDIPLQLQNEQLQEVVVTDEDVPSQRPRMSQVRLSPKDLKSMPAFFGENDILKTIQMLPGVQAGSEGSINYIVRGGSPDQNLILLDGVPVYNASHLFGFFSVFNVDAIKNVSLTKGGFPSRFGGRLSSVLEIDMKEGDMQEFHGAGSVGLLASKLTLEGPIVKDKASFMISGRRTCFDLFYRLLARENNGYFFDDINAKVNYKFSRKDRLYLSFYTGRDKLFSNFASGDYTRSTSFSFGNRTAALRWNHLYSDKLFSNLTATFTNYRLSVGNTNATPVSFDAREYYSRVQDYGLQYTFDYSLSPAHQLKMGSSLTLHRFQPGAMQFEEQDYNDQLDSALEISPTTYSQDAFLFVEDDWKINNRWRMNAGLHYSAYLVDGSFYHSLQPRVSARYLLSSSWSLKASYAYMQQYIHLLTNSGAGLPTDLWVSSTGKIPPQRSHQWAVGTTKELWDGQFEFTTEAYYKYMSHLIAFREGTVFTTSANWEDQVATGGTGQAYGWEFLLRKTRGKTTGWIAYTLARSTRHFADLNEGQAFPYKYDRRHDLKITLQHSFSKKFNMAFAFLYNSGIRATVPTATFTDFNGNQQILFSKRNAYNYPAYHRLDLSFNWLKKTKWGQRSWSLGIYNAYNRLNPFFIYFNLSGRSAKQFALFPVMPSFSYSFKF